jgi:hypothetical protein
MLLMPLMWSTPGFWMHVTGAGIQNGEKLWLVVLALRDGVEPQAARTLAATRAFPATQPEQRPVIDTPRELECPRHHRTLTRHLFFLDAQRRLRVGCTIWNRSGGEPARESNS